MCQKRLEALLVHLAIHASNDLPGSGVGISDCGQFTACKNSVHLNFNYFVCSYRAGSLLSFQTEFNKKRG